MHPQTVPTIENPLSFRNTAFLNPFTLSIPAMADRYCIASGVFTDAAIWSATDGGTGGAPVPTDTDAEIYNQSSSVTGRIGGISSNKNISIGANAEVSIAHALGESLAIKGGKKLAIGGKLSLIDAATTNIYSNATLEIAEDGRFDIGNATVNAIRRNTTSATVGLVDNKGAIDGTGWLYVAAIDVQAPHHIGRVPNMRIGCNSGSIVDPVTALFHGIIETNSLVLGLSAATGSSSLVCDFGDTDIRIAALEFNRPQTEAGRFVQVIQNGPMTVSGDIVLSGLTTPTTVDWQLGTNASNALIGTTDQTINMPPDVTGQTWTVDKPAGQLDLTAFSGFLLGRLRQLIVRGPSNIDLGGLSPVLQTMAGTWENYDGLKADSVSPREPTTVTEHLQEAMDSCENYGLITIPGGKTLCTKSFKNYTGAKVSGTGTLCVRYGGLTNTGIIDPTVHVRYFDKPALAVLSAPNAVVANTMFSVDLSGSVGDWFRVDWDDESFSETQMPGTLTHGYVDTSGAVLRTLLLTVGTDEGKTETVTKTMTVLPPPHEPDGPGFSKPVDIDPKKLLHGIPRGNLPTHYRYTLALGKRFMHDTLQLFCPTSESGRALANGSGLYLGRITHSDGQLPDPSEIAAASYTVYRLDAADAFVRTPIEGHTEVPLDVAEILLPELVVDANWLFDDIGYNFRHTPDDTTYSPFPVAGRDYLVVYMLRPLDQPPKIVFQYRVHVV